MTVTRGYDADGYQNKKQTFYNCKHVIGIAREVSLSLGQKVNLWPFWYIFINVED